MDVTVAVTRMPEFKKLHKIDPVLYNRLLMNNFTTIEELLTANAYDLVDIPYLGTKRLAKLAVWLESEYKRPGWLDVVLQSGYFRKEYEALTHA